MSSKLYIYSTGKGKLKIMILSMLVSIWDEVCRLFIIVIFRHTNTEVSNLTNAILLLLLYTYLCMHL